MPTRRRTPTFLVLAALLAACGAPVLSPTAGTSASVVALPTPTLGPGTPAPSGGGTFPAMPGLTYDAARSWAEEFSFECQEGLFPPNRSDELLAAVCTREVTAENAKMDLTIQYWPNNTVLAMSAAIQPITIGSEASDSIITEFFRWASQLPYAKANPAAILKWLQQLGECPAGCPMKVKGVRWTRTNKAGLHAVSAFVPG
jgi:hypothetical protein